MAWTEVRYPGQLLRYSSQPKETSIEQSLGADKHTLTCTTHPDTVPAQTQPLKHPSMGTKASVKRLKQIGGAYSQVHNVLDVHQGREEAPV